MSVTDELIAANADYVASFDKGDLPMPPGRQVAIVVCMDARIDPAKALGLEEGDPSLSLIEITGFASSFDETAQVQKVWDNICERSPILATLKKCCEIKMRLALT